MAIIRKVQEETLATSFTTISRCSKKANTTDFFIYDLFELR